MTPLALDAIQFHEDCQARVRPVVRALERRMNMGGLVYVIQRGDAGNIKIGFSRDPARRLADLATAADEPLHLRGTFAGSVALERRLHRRLSAFRLSGEWFVWRRPVLHADIEDFKMAARAEDHWINDYAALDGSNDPVIKRICHMTLPELKQAIRTRRDSARAVMRLADDLFCIECSHPEWEASPDTPLADILGVPEPGSL